VITGEKITGPAGVTTFTFNAKGQEVSEVETNTNGKVILDDVTHPDGSTTDASYVYNADGSYVETVVVTPACGSGTVTTTYDVNAKGKITNENAYAPGTNGSYVDTWAKQDGSFGAYWWNASTHEYLDTWHNSNGSYFVDEYQYAAGGSPSATNASFTETYSASDGSHGTRQFNATTGKTTIYYNSKSTGALSETTTATGFIGLQGNGELTNTQNDLTFFNPAVSPVFNALLHAHH
jgi:hypothetical protein